MSGVIVGPALRRLMDDQVKRPAASAQRNTVKALEDRCLIVAGKGDDPPGIEWHSKEMLDNFWAIDLSLVPGRGYQFSHVP